MRISEFKTALEQVETLTFQLPKGQVVPAHFHITEIGVATKLFIDCGGTTRSEQKITMQLWTANDTDHRLTVDKTKKIIEMGQTLDGFGDAEIEVEYQQETIGKFGLEFQNRVFKLTTTKTACLAWDACGIPVEKQKVSLANLVSKESSTCTPGGGCC